MLIKNKTKGTSIMNIGVANSFFAKMKGLMFKKGGRMLLKFQKEGSYQVWMPFMRFSIDILFMDKEKTIVDIIEHAVPFSFNPKTWKIYSPQRKCAYILEVESGLSETEGWSVGDVLEFIF